MPLDLAYYHTQQIANTEPATSNTLINTPACCRLGWKCRWDLHEGSYCQYFLLALPLPLCSDLKG